MTIEELYKWAIKNNCEKYCLCTYDRGCEESVDIEYGDLNICTYEENDVDNYDRLNFVEIL